VGNVTGTGPINATSGGNVTLTNSNGGITLTAPNQIVGSVLTVNALNASAVNTAVGTLNANISGSGQSLTVNQATGLVAGSQGIVANGNLNLVLASGSLTGNGGIGSTSGDVTITAAAGAINPTGVVSGNLLTIRAANASSLVTNVASLSANITGLNQSLTVTESNGLSIAAGGVVTNSALVSITSALGGISGNGVVYAGSGNVVLATPAGSVSLGNVANQVTANGLTLTALGSSVVNTNITSLNAAITGTGNLTVNEANNLVVTQARTTNGAINLTTTANSAVNIASINAATGTRGNLTVVNGNLFIDAPGVRATQTVDLRLAQSVTYLSGNIVAPVILLPNGQPTIYYLVTSSADSGAGSVRDRITQINAGGGVYNSTILVTSSKFVNLSTPLPTMTVQMNVNGNNLLTLDGTSLASTAFGFQITSTSSTTSTISGVTFQKFGGPAIDLGGARNISISGVTVTDSGLGFRATGNLSGTGVFGSTFTNNVIGGQLANARNLLVGVNPVGNVLQGNTFTGGTGFRGASTTGISISGTTTGTIVKANTFTGYPIAIYLAAATNATIGGPGVGEGNTISFAKTAGVYASGFCTGSQVIKTVFGSGVAAANQYVISTSRNLVITK